MAIVANKFPGVRAVVCREADLARHAREHNDANVLVLGADHTTPRQAQAVLEAWLNTPFGGGRHGRRLRQIQRIERKTMNPQGP
jgi:ribose 5-phosphate isomerase B